MWHCVEDRLPQKNSNFGKVTRKLIFGSLYIDRAHCLQRKSFNNDTLSVLKVLSV